MENKIVSRKRVLPDWIDNGKEVWMLFGVESDDPIKVRKFTILGISGNSVKLQPEKGDTVIAHVGNLFKTRNECRDAKKKLKAKN